MLTIENTFSFFPSKRSTLIRLYRLCQEIKRRSYPNVKDLMQLLEVSHRTIDRYIEFLRDDFGAPIEFDRKRSGYFFREKWSFPFPEFTEGEVLSLFLLINIIKQFNNTPLERSLKNLQKKLEKLFPAPLRLTPKNLEMILSPFISVIKPKVEIGQVFETIFEAIQRKRRIQITYTSFSSREKTIRIVEPYHIYNFEGVWYFCGFCLFRKEVRDFALDRIESIILLSEKFTIPSNFNPQEYLATAFRMFRGETIDITILFDAYQAKWIRERIWHPSQKIRNLENGELIFEVRANPEEIKRWVLGYGSHAEILKPFPFREEVKEEIKKMYSQYFNNAT